jgi:hypothetical protein
MRVRRKAWIVAPLGAGLALFAGISMRRPPDTERPLITRRGPEMPPAPTPADWRAPRDAEAAAAVDRIFRGAVRFDDRTAPVAGDFNADGSPDLAAAVRALPERLPDVNDPLANWTLQGVGPPGPPAPLGPSSPLVAVIHGVGASGWRAAEARQCVLLAAARAPDRLAPRPREAVLAELGARQARREASGDVLILADAEGSTSGFAYWTGARYAWHGPVPLGRRAAVSP